MARAVHIEDHWTWEDKSTVLAALSKRMTELAEYGLHNPDAKRELETRHEQYSFVLDCLTSKLFETRRQEIMNGLDLQYISFVRIGFGSLPKPSITRHHGNR